MFEKGTIHQEKVPLPMDTLAWQETQVDFFKISAIFFDTREQDSDSEEALQVQQYQTDTETRV